MAEPPTARQCASALCAALLGAATLVMALQDHGGLWTRLTAGKEAEPVPYVRVGRAHTAALDASAASWSTATSSPISALSALPHASATSSPPSTASPHASASRSHSAAPPHASASHSPRVAAPAERAERTRRPFLRDDTDAGAAAARRDTTACGETYYDSLVLHPPFHRCTSSQLFEAVSRGWRSEVDGPFHVRGCRLHWYSSSEACDLLARVGSLTIQGDSLARHLTQALVTILVGDYAGATNLRRDRRNRGYHACLCMEAYNDGHLASFPGTFRSVKNKYCRQHSIAELPFRSRKGQSLYCPAWRTSHLNNERSPSGVVYVSGGLHYPNLNATTVGALFGPDAKLASVPHRAGGSWARICGLMHAPGRNKPVKYLTSHGLAATERFNAMVEEACGDDHLFNPFSVTRNATSIDGQHYAGGPNLLLAQLLLNHVEAIAQGS